MRELFSPFKHQSKLSHLALVVAGAVAFVAGVYGTVFLIYDGPAVLIASGGDAVAARRTAIMVGATVCWLVFAVGFIRTIGGPALNALLYPSLIVVSSTGFAYSILFGTRPDHVYTEGFLYSPRFIVDSLTLFLPGIILFMLIFIVALKMGPATEEEQRAWMGHYLAESVLEKHHPDFENGEWIDRERDT